MTTTDSEVRTGQFKVLFLDCAELRKITTAVLKVKVFSLSVIPLRATNTLNNNNCNYYNSDLNISYELEQIN